MPDPVIHLFRHTLATLAYRAAKTMRGAPPAFADFKPGPTSNTPVEIVAHLGDLMDASLHRVEGNPRWDPQPPQGWDEECARLFQSIQRFDSYLQSGAPIHGELPRILQGPVADALTHVGQLAMLRRLFGVPMKGENYYRADVVVGRLDADQTMPDPRMEFD